MFTKSCFTHEDLKAFQSPDQTDDPIFQDMKDELKTLGLDVAFITALPKSDSAIVDRETMTRQPCLTFFIASHENYEQSGVKDRASDCDGTHKYTQAIRDIWARKCKEYGIDEDYCSSLMYIFFSDLLSCKLVELVSETKGSIVEYLNTHDYIRPDHVFVSSEPAIRMFYKDKETLDRVLSLREHETHEINIRRILKARDTFSCYSPELVKIEFLDVETQADKMYGYSRED